MASEPFVVNDINLFHLHVRQGRVKECESFLKAYPDMLNQRNEAYRETPLHIAATNPEESEVVLLILRSGVDVNARNYWSQTPLHYAAQSNNIKTMKFLLRARGINVNSKDVNGYTPLHVLVLSNDTISDNWVEGLKLLVEANADVNAKTNYGQSVLHLAASTQHGAEFLVHLLKYIPDTVWTARNSSEENALHILFRNTRCENYMYILFEIDLHFRDKTLLKHILSYKDLLGTTPWSVILDRGMIDKRTENVKKIVEIYGVSINSTDNFGNTALHRVVGRDGASFLRDIIGILLKNNIDVNLRNVFGQAAISVLFVKEVFDILIESNADFESPDRWGRKPFVVILNQNPMPKLVERMLREKCIDLRSADVSGSTALHFAAYNGFEEQTKLLLQNGSDTNAVDQLRDTPLKTAERHGNAICHQLIADAMHVPQRKDDKMFFHYKAPKEIRFSSFFENSNLNEILIGFPDDLRGYSEYLLKEKHISRRTMQENAEEFDIMTEVKTHVENICQYVKSYDSRFEMTVFPTGSTVEGTKVGRSDEFDFVLCLGNLNRKCEIKQVPDMSDPAYAMLKFDDYPAPEEYISFSDADGYFLALPFLMYLFRYIRRALHERKLWETGNLYYRFEDKIHVISGKPVFNFQMYWIGSKYKQIALSIDLVPAVYKRGWWPEKTRIYNMKLVTESVRNEGCFLLMQTRKNDFNKNWYDMSDSLFSTCNISSEVKERRLLRISVAPTEIALMKSLPEIFRRAYALAKIMKSADICPAVTIDINPKPIPFLHFVEFRPKPVDPSHELKSYWLKNCTFFVAEEMGLDVAKTTISLDVTILIYKKLTELTKSWRLRPYLLPQVYLLEFGSEEHHYSKVIDMFILRRKICLDIVMRTFGQPFPLERDYRAWVEKCEGNKNERDRERMHPANILVKYLQIW